MRRRALIEFLGFFARHAARPHAAAEQISLQRTYPHWSWLRKFPRETVHPAMPSRVLT